MKTIIEKRTMKEESKTWEPDSLSPLFLHDIKGILQDLYNQYRAAESRNEYLEKENTRLKSEAYKDEELSKMKESYEKMKSDYYRGFPISEKEDEKIREWEEKLMAGLDLKINSARFHYEFYPTGLGTAGYVIDSITGEKFCFQEIG